MVTNPTSDAFRRKILSFSELRLAPLFGAKELERLTVFMLALVDRCQLPPMRGNAVDWSEISVACNIPTRLTGKQKRIGQFGFDAVIRWVKNRGRSSPFVSDAADIQYQREHNSGGSRRVAVRTSKSDGPERVKPGPKPIPINDNPRPLFEIADGG